MVPFAASASAASCNPGLPVAPQLQHSRSCSHQSQSSNMNLTVKHRIGIIVLLNAVRSTVIGGQPYYFRQLTPTTKRPSGLSSCLNQRPEGPVHNGAKPGRPPLCPCWGSRRNILSIIKHCTSRRIACSICTTQYQHFALASLPVSRSPPSAQGFPKSIIQQLSFLLPLLYHISHSEIYSTHSLHLNPIL